MCPVCAQQVPCRAVHAGRRKHPPHLPAPRGTPHLVLRQMHAVVDCSALMGTPHNPPGCRATQCVCECVCVCVCGRRHPSRMLDASHHSCAACWVLRDTTTHHAMAHANLRATPCLWRVPTHGDTPPSWAGERECPRGTADCWAGDKSIPHVHRHNHTHHGMPRTIPLGAHSRHKLTCTTHSAIAWCCITNGVRQQMPRARTTLRHGAGVCACVCVCARTQHLPHAHQEGCARRCWCAAAVRYWLGRVAPSLRGHLRRGVFARDGGHMMWRNHMSGGAYHTHARPRAPGLCTSLSLGLRLQA